MCCDVRNGAAQRAATGRALNRSTHAPLLCTRRHEAVHHKAFSFIKSWLREPSEYESVRASAAPGRVSKATLRNSSCGQRGLSRFRQRGVAREVCAERAPRAMPGFSIPGRELDRALLARQSRACAADAVCRINAIKVIKRSWVALKPAVWPAVWLFVAQTLFIFFVDRFTHRLVNASALRPLPLTCILRAAHAAFTSRTNPIHTSTMLTYDDSHASARSCSVPPSRGKRVH